ncbi:2,3-diaminopropionate biosynthesis protein SbnA, partial [Streptomyces sp. M2CJ-2]|nr:2,3-diaminopropionate biosynthesis protein SbnA [Streptomyces sp. M2CJ-2]
GFLFGGSTGTVVSGAMRWLDDHATHGLTAVAIAPDLGERYLDTIYQSNWLHDLYGENTLDFDETAAGPRAADPVPTLQASHPPHPPAKRRRRR